MKKPYPIWGEQKITVEDSYERLLAKVHKLQALKSWEKAFRNLCYFVGEYEESLPQEVYINLCSDILRIGFKSKKANIQELGYWLRKAIEQNLELYSQPSLEDSFDLIETYSKFFRDEPTGQGEKILIDILTLIENPACELKLWNSYKQCADKIFINPRE